MSSVFCLYWSRVGSVHLRAEVFLVLACLVVDRNLAFCHCLLLLLFCSFVSCFFLFLVIFGLAFPLAGYKYLLYDL